MSRGRAFDKLWKETAEQISRAARRGEKVAVEAEVAGISQGDTLVKNVLESNNKLVVGVTEQFSKTMAEMPASYKAAFNQTSSTIGGKIAKLGAAGLGVYVLYKVLNGDLTPEEIIDGIESLGDATLNGLAEVFSGFGSILKWLPWILGIIGVIILISITITVVQYVRGKNKSE